MKIKTLTIFLAVVLGFGINAMANATEVASIDVVKIINASPKVQALRKEEQAKAKDLWAFVEKANKEVANVSDVEKKQQLQTKYSKQYAEKKEKIAKDYEAKRIKLEEEISKIIAEQAKAKGYDMVVPKGMVLYSTVDLTDEVLKAVTGTQKKK